MRSRKSTISKRGTISGGLQPPLGPPPSAPKKTWGRKQKIKKPEGPSGTKFEPENPYLPPLVILCIAFLEERGLEVEGIFRVSGSIARVKELKEKFEKGENVDMSGITEPHCVSSCLKLFLRELKDPVCTFDLYDCFLAGESMPIRSNRVSCLKKVMELLPPGNYSLLKAFIGLLKKIHDLSDINMMKASNLSIVFAPTLLKQRDEDHDSMMSDMNVTNRLVEHFILDYEEIFEGKECSDDEEEGNTTNDSTPALDSTVGDLSDIPPDGDLSQPLADVVNDFIGAKTGGRALIYVRGMWDFEAELADELSFSAGTLIAVLLKDGGEDKEGFWHGEYFSDGSNSFLPVPDATHTTRRAGWFQSDYTEIVTLGYPLRPAGAVIDVHSDPTTEMKTVTLPARSPQQINFVRSLSSIPPPLAGVSPSPKIDSLPESPVPPPFSQPQSSPNPSPLSQPQQPPSPRPQTPPQSQALPQPQTPPQPQPLPQPDPQTPPQPQPLPQPQTPPQPHPLPQPQTPPQSHPSPRPLAPASPRPQSSPRPQPPVLPPAQPVQPQQQQHQHQPPPQQQQLQQQQIGSGATRLVCRAKWDFVPPADKPSLLAFKRGDVIYVLKKGEPLKDGKPSQWWAGHLKGKNGHFPVAYTELFVVPAKNPNQPGVSGGKGGNRLSVAMRTPQTGQARPISKKEFDRMLGLAKQNRESQMGQYGDLQSQFAEFRKEEELGMDDEDEKKEQKGEEQKEEHEDDHELTEEEKKKRRERRREKKRKKEKRREERKEKKLEGSTESAEPKVPEPAGEEASKKKGGDWVEAVYDYTKSEGTPELSFLVGDLMKVVQRFPGGWMEVMKGEEKGFVPGTYVEPYELQ